MLVQLAVYVLNIVTHLNVFSTTINYVTSSISYEVSVEDYISHWKNEDNNSQKVKISCSLEIVSKLKHAVPGAVLSTMTRNILGTNLCKENK